jgi:hypothetical protein
VNSIQIPYALQSITAIQPMEQLCYHLLHQHNNLKMSIFFFEYELDLSQKNLNVMYFTRVCFLNSFFVHEPNNKQNYKFVHLFFISYAPIFMPIIS